MSVIQRPLKYIVRQESIHDATKKSGQLISFVNLVEWPGSNPLGISANNRTGGNIKQFTEKWWPGSLKIVQLPHRK